MLINSLARPSAARSKRPIGANLASDGRYVVHIARNRREVESALRLRHRVFNVELGGRVEPDDSVRMEFDAFDLRCRHLIVVCQKTGETIGTYRLNTFDKRTGVEGFYSASEFTLQDLPTDVLENSIEIGRACIDIEHRNTSVLFLLWKALLRVLALSGKRYFFGCCSIFSTDESIGAVAYRHLCETDDLSDRFRVRPLKNAVDIALKPDASKVELPNLFKMYLRIGAEVCGPPIFDPDFGSIDFFVVFDVTRMSDKYRRLFG